MTKIQHGRSSATAVMFDYSNGEIEHTFHFIPTLPSLFYLCLDKHALVT